MAGKMGSVDRLLRLVIGVILIYGVTSGMIGAWGWIGVVIAGTAALNFCPAYSVLGINTCGAESDEED